MTTPYTGGTNNAPRRTPRARTTPVAPARGVTGARAGVSTTGGKQVGPVAGPPVAFNRNSLAAALGTRGSVLGSGAGSAANPIGTRRLDSSSFYNPESGRWQWDQSTRAFDASFNPQPPGALPTTTTTSGGGGGGGGGGGAPAIDTASILALMGKRPQQYQWQNLDIPDYQAREFYAFNEQPYDQARTGLQQGLAADLQTGNQAYGDASAELANYKNPFAGRDYATQPAMSDAMQRMLSANGVAPDAATQGQGVQADAAFGNVLALLGGAATQQQASAGRALAGDQRRFGESLANEGRNLGLGIDMARARAQDQYEKDKWQYGEEVARMNYNTNMQEATANNQGQNQTAQANVAGNNTFDQTNAQTLIQMLAGGQAIDPALIQQYLGGGA